MAAVERTPEGDAFSGVVIRLIRLQGFLAEAGDELARPAGQTSARWQVLAAIEAGPATVADIARTLTLARQSVQRVADALAEGGIVEYLDNPRHAPGQARFHDARWPGRAQRDPGPTAWLGRHDRCGLG